jgi:hypothetical protein
VESQDTIADPAWRLHWDGSVSTVRAQAFDGGLVSATSAADDLPHIYGFGLNAASVRVMVDGTMGSTPLTAAFTGHMETRLGYSDVDGHHLRGVMGEILIWDRDLILAEEREAAYYLSARYGIDYGP